MKVMTVLQQLKKREIRNKKGHFKGYSGQASFKPNPNILGFSGMRRNASGKLEPYVNAIAGKNSLQDQCRKRKSKEKI